MFTKTTEQSSFYQDLEKMSTQQLLTSINQEDKKVAEVAASVIPQLSLLVENIADKMLSGGRLFYMGAGTSGRLGILDASECPPTYGVPFDLVIGIIAGGDRAIRKAVEGAEDDKEQGWKDLQTYSVNENDVVVGIAASGTTPYVIEALRTAQKNGITTACITCNENSPVMEVSDYKLVAVTGPEFVTGSTRMKAGTVQKLILNMLSTSVMIKIGRVEGNRMVNMQLTNEKLIDRGTKMIMESSSLNYEEAKELLLSKKSVKNALESLNKP